MSWARDLPVTRPVSNRARQRSKPAHNLWFPQVEEFSSLLFNAITRNESAYYHLMLEIWVQALQTSVVRGRGGSSYLPTRCYNLSYWWEMTGSKRPSLLDVANGKSLTMWLQLQSSEPASVRGEKSQLFRDQLSEPANCKSPMDLETKVRCKRLGAEILAVIAMKNSRR